MKTIGWAFLFVATCSLSAVGSRVPAPVPAEDPAAINQSLLDDDDQGAEEQACKPDGAACRNGDRCCGYCCSNTCRKHANCTD